MTEQNLQHFLSRNVKSPQKLYRPHSLILVFFSEIKEKHVAPSNVGAHLHCRL